MLVFKRLLFSTIISLGLISPALAPAQALDYEAKPVHTVISAPFRVVGAVSGAAVSGLFSGPVDDGFHASKKATSRIAGAFGDENGKLQIAAAAPVAVPLGLVVGGVRGMAKGTMHGFRKGWDKPFSRWSFITMEEEGTSKK